MMSITEQTDFDELDALLQAEEQPADPYDLLQQAIIAGNQAALSYLLMRNYRSVNHHPQCNDYLHLACKLKREVMIKTIIECRPEDMNIAGRVCYPNACFHDDSSSKLLSSIGQRPLDIIVSSGSVASLATLLVHMSQRSPNKLAAPALLCEMNHPSALSMMLKSPVVTHADFTDAYLHALKKKRHSCLQVIISAGYKELHVRSMNPYHVLYIYSSGYNRHPNRHAGLTATTNVLLKAGADIHSYRPAGSYPLYSIIELILKDASQYGDEYLSEAISDELINTLKLVIKQGVRIDLNERNVSLSSTDGNEQPAFGRDIYSSVYDVLSSHCMKLDSINLAASEILQKCTDILLSHKGHYRLSTTHLSGLMHIMGKSGHSKTIMRNLECIFRKYIECGVSTSLPIPQTYGAGQYGCASSHMYVYLVNHYVDALCECDLTGSLAHTINSHPVLRWIINTMTYNSICSANQINIRMLSRCTHMDRFTPSLMKLITKPPLLRLKTLSARAVWFSVGRRQERISVLPIPKSMKSSIIDIITKEI